MEVRVYPVNKAGKIVRGFCPTLCESAEAEEVAYDLAANMIKFGFEFEHIVIEEA